MIVLFTAPAAEEVETTAVEGEVLDLKLSKRARKKKKRSTRSKPTFFKSKKQRLQ
jgi:hypothetical protein